MSESEPNEPRRSGTWVAVSVGIGGVSFVCGLAGVLTGRSPWGGIAFAALGLTVFAVTVIRG